MTLLRKDSILSVLVVGILLVGSTFVFIPAFAASPAPASLSGSSPATVAGATATIDAPVLAGLSTAIVRTITLSNPIGNPAITSLTISVPKAAASVAPTGAFPADSGTPAGVTVNTYGVGPWAVVYSDGSASALLPGGASIKLQLGFTTETALTTTGVADPYQLSISAADSSGSTNLTPITVYETATAAGGLILKAPTSSPQAGTNFAVTVSGADSGLPLSVTSSDKTTTVTPSTFTTTSGTTTLTVNDTTEGTLTLTVGSGTFDTTDSSGGQIDTSVPVTIAAGQLYEVTTLFGVASGTGVFYRTGDIINETSLTPILGLDGSNAHNNITVTLADKFGNPVPATTTITITLTLVAVNAQCTGVALSSCFGFSTSTAYNTGGSYPYTPTTAPVQSLTITISSGSSITLPDNYFYGPDYGAKSYITTTAAGSNLASSNSAMIQTLTVSSTAGSIAASPTSVQAGKTSTITYTLPSTAYQAGVTVYFVIANTSAYNGVFSNGQMQVAAVTTISGTTPVASAKAVLTVDTTSGNSAPIQVIVNVPGSDGAAANVTMGTSASILTTGGPLSKVTLDTAYDALMTNPSTATNSTGGLYVNAMMTDAFGNPSPVPVDTQVTFGSSGTLSTNLGTIYAGCTDTAAVTAPCTFGSSNVVASPKGGQSSYTVTATLSISGTTYTATATIQVASLTPILTLVPPTTTGVVSFKGVANVSAGVSSGGAPGYIQGIQYCLNSCSSNVTVVNSTSTSVTYAFTLALTGSNFIQVYAEDSAGNWAVQTANVPPIAPSASFTFAATPAQVSLSSAYPVAVNATIMNHQALPITAVVVAVASNSAGQQGIFTGTVTVAPGATTSAFPVISGLASGTYTVQVFVLSTQGGTLSPSTTTTVTVS